MTTVRATVASPSVRYVWDSTNVLGSDWVSISGEHLTLSGSLETLRRFILDALTGLEVIERQRDNGTGGDIISIKHIRELLDRDPFA